MSTHEIPSLGEDKSIDSKVHNVDNATEMSQPEDATAEIYIDPVIEQRIMRKFDMWVLPQFGLLNILSYMDRANIGEY